MKKILYLMRHGQTLFNLRNKLQGVCDSPLTREGIKQAIAAGEYFKGIDIDHYYSSTAERASDTLELVTNHKVQYTRLKGLKEMNYGVFEGESEELCPSGKLFDTFFVPFGGEAGEDVKNRIVKTCTDIMEQDDNKVVLAVSHGEAIIRFLSAWNNPSEILDGEVGNCTIFKYEYENKKFKLLKVIRPSV